MNNYDKMKMLSDKDKSRILDLILDAHKNQVYELDFGKKVNEILHMSVALFLK